jgi:hypothetical protein
MELKKKLLISRHPFKFDNENASRGRNKRGPEFTIVVSTAKMLSSTISASFLLSAALMISPWIMENTTTAAYAMGPPPGSCENEYNYTVKSITANNGIHTFDLLANQGKGIIFNANNVRGYDITFTIHAANQSKSDNTQNGSIWFGIDSFGYENGGCVTGIVPNQDKTVTIKDNIAPSIASNPNLGNDGFGTLAPVEMSFTDPSHQKFTYEVDWYKSSNYPRDTGTSKVKIDTLDYNNTNYNNNEVKGAFVELKSNGKIVAVGFTPVTFTLQNGKEYQIEAMDYGKYHFFHWADKYGSSGTTKMIKLAESGKVDLIAYYIETQASNSSINSNSSSLPQSSLSGQSFDFGSTTLPSSIPLTPASNNNQSGSSSHSISSSNSSQSNSTTNNITTSNIPVTQRQSSQSGPIHSSQNPQTAGGTIESNTRNTAKSENSNNNSNNNNDNPLTSIKNAFPVDGVLNSNAPW